MKKIIALVTALILVLSLAACGGNTGSSTADESAKADVSTYTKDFEGLQKYIADRNQNGTTAEIYYDILGADNGVRYVLNGNAYVEIYDFSKADNDTAKAILADIKDDGKFSPMPNSTEMTAAITKSGKYVLAWDASRSFKYTNDSDKTAGVVSTELIENW